MALEALKYANLFSRFTNMRPGVSLHELTYRARIGSERNDPRLFDLSIPLSAFPGLAEDEQAHEQREGQREKQSALAGLAAVGGTLWGGLSGVGGGSASAGGTAAASATPEMLGGSELLANELAAPTLAHLSEAAPVTMAGGSELLANELAAPELSHMNAFPGMAKGAAAAAPGTLERLIAAGGPSLLGYIGADKQADALQGQADRYFAMGEPYRRTLAEISADPSKFYESPGAQQATDAVLRRLSVGGNPAHNPYSQSLAIDSLYDHYGRERDRLAGFGGLTQYNAAAPGTAAAATGAEANKFNAIGAGMADFFYPPKRISLSDISRIGLS